MFSLIVFNPRSHRFFTFDKVMCSLEISENNFFKTFQTKIFKTYKCNLKGKFLLKQHKVKPIFGNQNTSDCTLNQSRMNKHDCSKGIRILEMNISDHTGENCITFMYIFNLN